MRNLLPASGATLSSDSIEPSDRQDATADPKPAVAEQPPVPPVQRAEPKTIRVRTIAIVGAVVAAIGGISGFLGNIEHLSGPFARIGVFVGEHGAAAAIAQNSIRDRLARAALERVHPDGLACFESAVPIDLNGNGVKSDLAVVFRRTAKPKDCRDLGSPQDAAFFISAWNGYRYVGDPELPAAVTAWHFAGPAAFREDFSSTYPPLYVFMLRDGKIAKVGGIETVSSDDYGSTEYIDAKDGRSAWIINAAGISRVSIGKDGQALVEKLDGKRLVAENQGLHLLSFDAEGHLSFDGEASRVQPDTSSASATAEGKSVDVADLRDGDRFVIRMSPGDHLYLAGCRPAAGLTPVPTLPGAFAIDLGKSPSVRCALGEESGFSVAIAEKDY